MTTALAPIPFALAARDRDGLSVLAVAGGLDLFTGPDLRDRAAAHAARAPGQALVLDLAECPSVDSAGCAAVLAAWRAIRARGGRLVVARAHGAPARTFATMGLGELLPVVGSLDEAALAARL